MIEFDDQIKWQAMSCPELADTKPEHLFNESDAARYQKLHHDLWERILNLHGTIRTLETLERFPFNFLYPPNDMEFWRLVVGNFLDAAVISLHGLINDGGRDAHSLQTFRRQIASWTWRDESRRDLFHATLRERKFDAHLDSVAGRIGKLRTNYIAHRLVDRESGGLLEPISGVTLKELRALFNGSQLLFGALTFGGLYPTLAGDLLTTHTCLDSVLDAVIRNSPAVNIPERRAQWWQDERKFWRPDELQILNELRRRIGLHEA